MGPPLRRFWRAVSHTRVSCHWPDVLSSDSPTYAEQTPDEPRRPRLMRARLHPRGGDGRDRDPPRGGLGRRRDDRRRQRGDLEDQGARGRDQHRALRHRGVAIGALPRPDHGRAPGRAEHPSGARRREPGARLHDPPARPQLPDDAHGVLPGRPQGRAGDHARRRPDLPGQRPSARAASPRETATRTTTSVSASHSTGSLAGRTRASPRPPRSSTRSEVSARRWPASP